MEAEQTARSTGHWARLALACRPGPPPTPGGPQAAPLLLSSCHGDRPQPVFWLQGLSPSFPISHLPIDSALATPAASPSEARRFMMPWKQPGPEDRLTVPSPGPSAPPGPPQRLADCSPGNPEGSYTLGRRPPRPSDPGGEAFPSGMETAPGDKPTQQGGRRGWELCLQPRCFAPPPVQLATSRTRCRETWGQSGASRSRTSICSTSIQAAPNTSRTAP